MLIVIIVCFNNNNSNSSNNNNNKNQSHFTTVAGSFAQRCAQAAVPTSFPVTYIYIYIYIYTYISLSLYVCIYMYIYIYIYMICCLFVSFSFLRDARKASGKQPALAVIVSKLLILRVTNVPLSGKNNPFVGAFLFHNPAAETAFHSLIWWYSEILYFHASPSMEDCSSHRPRHSLF